LRNLFQGRRRFGFTLVELLTVIVIIAVIASLTLPAIIGARRKANWTQCQSNLHQLSLAWMDYRYQNRDDTPDWLSSLYPEYCSSALVYVCPGDRLEGRIDGSKPQDLVDNGSEAFNSTDDNWGNNGIPACSYFYEMCNTNCEYVGGVRTWKEQKIIELQGKDRTMFPVIRCFHHWKDKQYEVRWPGALTNRMEGMTINVAYDGNILFSCENWKATIVRVH